MFYNYLFIDYMINKILNFLFKNENQNEALEYRFRLERILRNLKILKKTMNKASLFDIHRKLNLFITDYTIFKNGTTNNLVFALHYITQALYNTDNYIQLINAAIIEIEHVVQLDIEPDTEDEYYDSDLSYSDSDSDYGYSSEEESGNEEDHKEENEEENEEDHNKENEEDHNKENEEENEEDNEEENEEVHKKENDEVNKQIISELDKELDKVILQDIKKFENLLFNKEINSFIMDNIYVKPKFVFKLSTGFDQS